MKENGYSLHDKKIYNIFTNKWILWNVFIRLLKKPLQPYNEKKFEVYYFRGERRTSSKCLIYVQCPTVTKKTPRTSVGWKYDSIHHPFVRRGEAYFCDERMKIAGSDRKYLSSEYCRCTRLAAASDKVYQLFAHGLWFPLGTPASSSIKTGRRYYSVY